MTERPILFSGAMVRAILEGRKTQTRRLAKVNDHDCKPGFITPNAGWTPRPIAEHASYCPYGVPGDRLWVRETLRTHGHFGFPLGECPQVKPMQGRVWSYAADNVPDHTGSRPSIHMPRWACRLVLEVTAVRVERLQEISREDAAAEGHIRKRLSASVAGAEEIHLDAALDWYRDLWDSLNAKRAPWASNPWVWVVEFRKP